MTDARPGDGLTIKQLLNVLRDRITSILQNKPPDLTLDEARTYTQGISEVLIRTRCLVNSFHVTVRMPPEVVSMISSYLAEEDLFSASQVCHYWRSVLISSPSLWTRISCRRVPRTLVSIDRCKSLPIRLRLEPPFSTAALEDILLHGNGIASLTISHKPSQIPLLRHLFKLSRPSLEHLHICAEGMGGWRAEQQQVHDVWDHLPSLRELFVCRYSVPIEKINAPNLIHLALERTGYSRDVTIKTILHMLRGCPLLETLLFNHSDVISRDASNSYAPVCLPRLRGIEVGAYEVYSGLITHLEFPPNVAAGFRMVSLNSVCGNIPLVVKASIQQVLTKVDICSITLAAPLHSLYTGLLFRFEGLQGSLEVTTEGPCNHEQLRDVFFGPDGVLFSHSPRVENVRELQIIGCSLGNGRGLSHINAAMPNIASISFFQCNGPNTFDSLAPKNPSLLPFPRLERVMVLGRESGLEEMARRRRVYGAPLRTLIIGQGPRGFEYGHLRDYTMLEGLVDNLLIGCPAEILEWGAGNDIRNIWSSIKVPGPHLTVPQGVFRFCRFNIPG